jgi:hypothetical protein
VSLGGGNEAAQVRQFIRGVTGTAQVKSEYEDKKDNNQNHCFYFSWINMDEFAWR